MKNSYRNALLRWRATCMLAVLSASLSVTNATQQADLFSQLQNQRECRFAGVFTQSKQLSGLSVPIESSGQFLYDCDRGVIWATLQPESDVLALVAASSLSTAQAHRIVGGDIKRLKNRQAKFLSNLIMNLMSADREALSTQFEIQSMAPNRVKMEPIKRGLKRAIKSVEVALVESSELSPTMHIEILDRNNQLTQIQSSQQRMFTKLDTDMCVDQGFTNAVCMLIFATNDTQVGA